MRDEQPIPASGSMRVDTGGVRAVAAGTDLCVRGAGQAAELVSVAQDYPLSATYGLLGARFAAAFSAAQAAHHEAVEGLARVLSACGSTAEWTAGAYEKTDEATASRLAGLAQRTAGR